MNFGKAFKNIRESNNSTRKETANGLGMSLAALWKIEHCRTIPKPATISKFCSLMGVPIAFVYMSAMELKDFKAE